MDVVIFTDGACLGNPGPGGWGTIVWRKGIDVTELGGHQDQTTNNRMEIQAAVEAIRFLNAQEPKPARVTVYADSKYVIQGITQWIRGWKSRGWVTAESAGAPSEVKNRDAWEALDQEVTQLSKTTKFEWAYVKGHAEIPGNERCDEIAVSFAKEEVPDLYQGPDQDYRVDLTKTVSSQPKPRGKPYYLSIVGGKIFRDDSWSQCEARVRGQKGVKYKKVTSPEEEVLVLAGWGVKS